MKRNLFSALLPFLIFVLHINAAQAAVDEGLSMAEKHYQIGEYEKALTIWYGLTESGHSDAGLFYNIGAAEALLGHVPASVLAFEKALRIKPMNREIHKALMDQHKLIEEATIPVQPFFLLEWYRGVLSLARPGTWALLGLLLWIGVIFNLMGRLKLISGRFKVKYRWNWFVAGMGVLFIFFAFLSYGQIYRKGEAILFTACQFKSAPTEESPQQRMIYPGEKLFIKDKIGDWYHIHLLNLDAGWIKRDCFQFIFFED